MNIKYGANRDLQGDTKLYFMYYSYVVIIFSIRVNLSLHILLFFLRFLYFLLRNFDFDAIFIELHLYYNVMIIMTFIYLLFIQVYDLVICDFVLTLNKLLYFFL